MSHETPCILYAFIKEITDSPLLMTDVHEVEPLSFSGGSISGWKFDVLTVGFMVLSNVHE